MNIKHFLIFKACDVLPIELKYIILNFVRDASAICIQSLYISRVARNIDIFKKIMEMSNTNNGYTWHYVNMYIKYANKNILYGYIQEPRIWISYLENLLEIYGIHRYFNINNLLCIINTIKYKRIYYSN